MLKSGSILICKQDYHSPISFFKKGKKYEIYDKLGNKDIYFIAEKTEDRLGVKTYKGGEYFHNINTSTPNYIWDYFYTIKELRKLKIIELENNNS